MAGSPAPHEGCRPAEAADLPALATLVGQGVGELRIGRGGVMWELADARRSPYEARLEAELADPDVLVLAGTIDDVVVGYAVVHLEGLADGSLLGVIDDLYTEPAARSVGVGEQMMASVLTWCRDRGCRGVDGLALPGDRHTKNFFEANGLVARAIVVHRSLG